MRALLTVLLIGVSVPAYAGCRLSTADCSVIAEEMRQAEIAMIVDRRSPAYWSMASYPAGLWLIDRKYARLRERIAVLPKRIGDEYGRIELCNSRESLRATGSTPNPAYDPRCDSPSQKPKPRKAQKIGEPLALY